MRIVALASGSKGNACVVESGGATLLVDDGLCLRDLKARAAEASVALETLAGVVLTHSHTDHTKGLVALHNAFPDVPLFANLMTAESVMRELKLDEEAFWPFENGQDFEVGPFSVRAFSIPHDTADPVGYLVRAEGLAYFHGTDIGTPLDSIGVNLAEADFATLESNHDPVMLHTSNRPEMLKQRIRGPRGHLSNDQACDLVRRWARPQLKALGLAHLSGECNAPHVAEGAMRANLVGMGRADLHLAVYRQDAPVVLTDGARSL